MVGDATKSCYRIVDIKLCDVCSSKTESMRIEVRGAAKSPIPNTGSTVGRNSKGVKRSQVPMQRNPEVIENGPLLRYILVDFSSSTTSGSVQRRGDPWQRPRGR